MKTAIFVGSFNPFTIGHFNIVQRALPLFDKIVVGIGNNINKKYYFSANERFNTVKNIYQDNPKIEVKLYQTLTIDFAKENGAEYIIRSVRSVQDFEYEQNMAVINKKLAGIETILFFAEQNLRHVSSSMVRELLSFGKDASEFLPE
jgi:pantetheine-phosphate adenylyltransferase